MLSRLLEAAATLIAFRITKSKENRTQKNEYTHTQLQATWVLLDIEESFHMVSAALQTFLWSSWYASNRKIVGEGNRSAPFHFSFVKTSSNVLMSWDLSSSPWILFFWGGGWLVIVKIISF